MSISRRESEERQRVVLRFFMDGYARGEQPTGEEAQRALTSGRLDGNKGQPPLGTGMLHRIQRQAKELAAKGLPAPTASRTLVIPNTTGHLDEAKMQALREKGRPMQDLLNSMPDGVLEVRISRDGIEVVRLTPTTERL